ncbi:MAG: hypothetical protein ABJG86_22685 [Nitratireductor sp.]
MLSSLPKLADRSFLIGYLVPAALFLAAFASLFSDWPGLVEPLGLGGEADGLEVLAKAAISVWLFAIVLSLLNTVLYQVVEGYRPPVAWLGFLKRRALARHDAAKHEIDTLAAAWKKAGNAYPKALQDRHDQSLQHFVAHYPSDRDLVLPTRFGNTIRAFEDYSRALYGADSIPLWIHLTTVIPKDFLENVNDARTHVNSLLNIVVLATMFGVLALARYLASMPWADFMAADLAFMLAGSQAGFLLYAIAAIVTAWLAYELAIERSVAWGSLVKAAFDCFLPDLGQKLGATTPQAAGESEAFWVGVSRQAIYNRPRPQKAPATKKPAARAGKAKTNTARARSTAGGATKKQSAPAKKSPGTGTAKAKAGGRRKTADG